jgi:hypothetical protein
MSLKDSILSAKATSVRSYASFSQEEKINIASCDSLLDSIVLLRKLFNMTAVERKGMLQADVDFCRKIRGEFLMGRLR